MQAIILAAGMGKRLKELTQNSTKCMVKVNGVTLIERMLHQIEKQHLSRIIIVVGYEGKKLIDHVTSRAEYAIEDFPERHIRKVYPSWIDELGHTNNQRDQESDHAR